jgi:2-dehydro-3-deoxyphosphogluconate aldolase / (4S)-4-hydroxy-2-oxoglutarate aldolase
VAADWRSDSSGASQILSSVDRRDRRRHRLEPCRTRTSPSIFWSADLPEFIFRSAVKWRARREGKIMHSLFRGVTVIPVLTIERETHAVPLARALLDGGLSIIEVTLRTPAAAAAIAAIVREVPQIVIGAGTVQRPSDVVQACAAGASFLVSPGMTAELAAAALATQLPYIPGVATPSEVMTARDLGISFLKLFPAEAVGGLAMLRALAPVFAGIAFCPTGGIDEQSAAEYLALPNVPMVGGSWMAPRQIVAAEDWARVRRLAERAAAIGPRTAD